MFSGPGYNKTTILPQDITQYPEFDQRHVMELAKLYAWTEQQTEFQFKYNRILQIDYLACDAVQLITAAKLARQSWLTDFAPLKLQPALYFNICAELLTFYQIKLDDCAFIADEIYLKSIDNPTFKLLEEKIKTKLSSMHLEIEDVVKHKLETEFKDISKESIEYNKIKKALYFIETSMRQKALTNVLLETYVSSRVNYFTNMLGITKKPVKPKNYNDDFCITGAPGSGKSSIVKTLININKDEYISICTDDYRAFYLPFTQSFEDYKPDQQRFIRTQDTAYLIKELIALRLSPEKLTQGRPNIYIDSIILENWQRELIKHSQSLTSAIAGLSDVGVVPKRAYQRAETSTNPADSKRHFNTTALLTSHRLASRHLLENTPEETKTMVYDTRVPMNQKPVLMAILNNKDENSNIMITDLLRFCDFMGKGNINVDADFGGTLFFDISLPKYRFTYDGLYKAEKLLKLIEPNPHCKIKNFDLFIMQESKNENPVCKISYIAPGSFELSILDKKLFIEMLEDPDKKQKEQLKALILILCYGKNTRHQVEVLGKHGAFFNAMKLLELDEYLSHTSAAKHTQSS